MNSVSINVVLLGILILAVVFMVVLQRRKSQGGRFEPNYYTWFLVGAIWTPVGLALSLSQGSPGNYGLLAMGVIFLALGLANRKKWVKLKPYSELTPAEKRLKWIAVGLALILIFLVGGYLILSNTGTGGGM